MDCDIAAINKHTGIHTRTSDRGCTLWKERLLRHDMA